MEHSVYLCGKDQWKDVESSLPPRSGPTHSSKVRLGQAKGLEVQMAIFQCGECGCGEDTALCHYWSARVRETTPLCSACDPKIGKWHGHFPREPFELFHEREIQRLLEMSWVRAPAHRRAASAA